METDADILAEAAQFDKLSVSTGASSRAPKSARALSSRSPVGPVPLYIVNSTYMTSPDTAALLQSIGGPAAVRRMTDLFYSRVFADRHLAQFFYDTADPHAARLANWIVEKMSAGADASQGLPWTEERVERAKCPVATPLSNGTSIVVHDRSSAHAAAWWSMHRAPRDAGQHFKVHDCRVWMRLMFWSARDCELLAPAQPAFEDWFTRFIGHFVRVYERAAPRFARESARWSTTPTNVEEYERSGEMRDVLGPDGDGASREAWAAQVPDAELRDVRWPYDIPHGG